MLFAVKNRFLPTLLLAALLAAVALAARSAMGLSEPAAPLPLVTARAAAGLVLIVASDTLIHVGLWLLGGDRYRNRYREFVAYFRPQRAREIAASGVLAGCEEMLFRGVLLAALVQRVEWSPLAAIAVTALLFGAAHLPRDAKLAPFALWAVWEGALLGGLYLATGSLLTLTLIHAAHDIVGFTVMAWQRKGLRKGRTPPPIPPPRRGEGCV
jgi:membrane protease YdiL (CAAX protease family)